MNHELTQRTLIGLVVLVLISAIVIVAGPGITANVVQETACGCSSDEPVCAVVNGTAYDYVSACEAECEGARILSKGFCSNNARNK